MTNKKPVTKRALLLLSLLVCVSMPIGTTYAWFTDSVTSSGNIIKAGTLKIDLAVKNGQFDTTGLTADSERCYSIKAAAEACKPTAIFSYDK